MTTQTGERRKVRVGRVVSDGMDKTVVVAVERRVSHRFYGKTVRHLTKFKAHDEQNAFRVGDVVRITETRPLSKTKRWRVTELLVRQELPEIEPAVAAEVNVEEANPQRRRGPTKAAVKAAARRAAAGGAASVVAKAAKAVKAPKAEAVVEAEDASAEEEAVVEEPEAEAEETPAEDDAPADTENAEDTEEEKGS